MSDFEIRAGDARDLLESLPADSIDAMITSPPYFGLRDYGIQGQIGAERYYPDFIDHLVAVFEQVRRVLKPAGTLWLNLGDSYATGAGTAVGECPGGGEQGQKWLGYRGAHGPDPKAAAIGPTTQANRLPQPGLKAKDLMMIPARVAIALQASGWYLRADLIWCKPNGMPESIEDRPTKAHEHVFLFSKSERYYYDGAAIVEQQSEHERTRRLREQQNGLATSYDVKQDQSRPRLGENSVVRSVKARQALAQKGTRNARSFWIIPAEPNKEKHFAMMPLRLAERCLFAGTSDRGVCPACGIAWQRIEERTPMVLDRSERRGEMGESGQSQASGKMIAPPSRQTIGWKPSCLCQLQPEPALVLDPFCGAATTGLACLKHGRRFLGFELNPEYVALALDRAREYFPLFAPAPGDDMLTR